MNSITLMMRIFILSSLSFCTIMSQMPTDPIQDDSEEKKKEMTLEEAYEALEKNDLEKKSKIIPNEELRDKLLILTVERSDAEKSRELLILMKKVHDDYKKKQQEAVNKIQQELDACNERSAKRALYTGVGLGAFACSVCFGIYQIAYFVLGKISPGKTS